MERVREERSRDLTLLPVDRAVDESQPAPLTNASVATTVPTDTIAQLRRQRRPEQYQQVVALFKSGHSQRAVSGALGPERKTIRRWLRSGHR
jgi:hypothetical protein